MLFDELERKSVVILGFGTEGQATYEFIRQRWPQKHVAIADRRDLSVFDPPLQQRLQSDSACALSLGAHYLDHLSDYDVIIKTPGMPASMVRAASATAITSHSALFLANYPRERIVGITGTKGKSTTTSLIFDILRKAGVDVRLAGNIGAPPLPMLKDCAGDTYFVHEFSSHQLAEVEHSPHYAVLLNIVPEHLDYYADFSEYVAAKENITRFQTPTDMLIFNSDHPEPQRIANRTRACGIRFSMVDATADCYVRSGWIVSSAGGATEEIVALADVPLLGAFNSENVLAAVAVSRLFNAPPQTIRTAIQEFRPLPHRLELVGTFKGIRFYDDSIATVPEAALGALDALGSVATLILGGHERNLDYTDFGKELVKRGLETLIFFPTTGERIWKAVQSQLQPGAPMPKAFFVDAMQEAVRLAYTHTAPGKVCLLSPASPSFGMFKDYKDRGDSFKAWVLNLGLA
jgi:UDP-N-acetylmuramoyl-L-alanine---L-glutamate ligase